MAYGDPTAMAGWNLGAGVNPNSALAQAALKAQQDTLNAQGTRENAGTLFSSLMQRDLGNIATTQQNAQLKAYQDYQNALSSYNEAMTRATSAREAAVAKAQADERQSAINSLPSATNPAGGTSTNVTSKVPVKAPSTKGGGKAPTLKGGTTPKTKSTLPRTGSKTPTKTTKPPAVSKVKTMPKITGKKR
jgi:hypothetical protein